MFCFVVIAREFGDVPRTVSILNAGPDAGFSGCNDWRIYSNVSHIAGLSDHRRCNLGQTGRVGACVERAINGSMNVPYGTPEWAWWQDTALNTPIFQQVWRHVSATSPYRRWARTVKTEVDDVFQASRMSSLLMNQNVADAAVIATFQNDISSDGILRRGTGLRGPVEAMTSYAMARFAVRFDECDAVASHNPLKGEDWCWLLLCMDALNVQRRVVWELLEDAGSNQGHPEVGPCDNGHVAWHPRKETWQWMSCYRDLTRGIPARRHGNG